ncbi:hypothetical protein BDR05DRAFT_1004414 [Suillus weaverae]|nr:hypothetical protein BDR05DRAFT_1004414 [Suillus weaverae]
MIVHEALNEDDLSSNACDTNLVDKYTHIHAGKGQQRIGQAKGVSHKKMGSRLTSKQVLKHPIPTPISLKGMPIGNGTYVGKRVENVDRVQDLQMLLDKGFHLAEWDGRSPQTLLDKNGRVIGILASQPQDDGWELTISQACTAMENVWEHCILKLSDIHHWRGLYSCLAAAVSYGGGQQQPGNLQNLKANQDELRALLSEPAIQTLKDMVSLGSSFGQAS